MQARLWDTNPTRPDQITSVTSAFHGRVTRVNSKSDKALVLYGLLLPARGRANSTGLVASRRPCRKPAPEPSVHSTTISQMSRVNQGWQNFAPKSVRKPTRNL